MKDRYFIDTNILVYSFDVEAKAKQEKAQTLVAEALVNSTGIISCQVVQEFLNAATRKFLKPLTFLDAQRYLNIVLEPLCQVFSSIELYHQALEIMNQWRYGFYDSLIIAAALQADCSVLFTEDLQHEQKIRDLTILNPFRESQP